jgi:hypothetical protein
MAVAVDLDHQPPRRPLEVHLDAPPARADRHVDERLWDPGRRDEREEPVLEGAAGAGAAGFVGGERVGQHPLTPPPRGSCHRGAGGGRVEAPAERRLVDDVGELRRVQHVGEVDQGAGHGRDRDAVVGGDVAGVEVAARPDPDPRSCATAARGDDVDLAGGPTPDAPEHGRAQVTQRRALTAREHAREPAPLL